MYQHEFNPPAIHVTALIIYFFPAHLLYLDPRLLHSPWDPRIEGILSNMLVIPTLLFRVVVCVP